MTYKIAAQPKAWWPIRFKGVTEDGNIVVNEIRGRFRILDEDEHVQLQIDTIAASRPGDADDEFKASEAAAPFVLRILEDWQGVVEDDGTEAGASLPFTPDNLKRMLNVPNFATGVAEAYRALRAGEPDLRKGN